MDKCMDGPEHISHRCPMPFFSRHVVSHARNLKAAPRSYILAWSLFTVAHSHNLSRSTFHLPQYSQLSSFSVLVLYSCRNGKPKCYHSQDKYRFAQQL